MQSPLRACKSDGYHYYISAPSPVDYCESPEREFVNIAPTHNALISAPLAQSTPLKNITEADVERSVSASSLSPTDPGTLDSIASDVMGLDSTRDTTPGQEVTGFIYDESFPEPEFVKEGSPSASEGVIPPKPPRLGDLPNTSVESGVAPLDQSGFSGFDLTRDEENLHSKMDQMASPDNYKLAFPAMDESMLDSSNDNGGDGSYQRHSPDEYGHQVGYDPFLGHYSHGGRGYPHGAYVSPSPSAEGSDLAGVHSNPMSPSDGPDKRSPSPNTLTGVNQRQLPSNKNNTCDVTKDTTHRNGVHNSCHGNGSYTNTGITMTTNPHTAQLDKNLAAHNGLSAVAKVNNMAVMDDTIATSDYNASPQDPLLGKNIKHLNKQNSLTDSERGLLLANEHEAPVSSGGYIFEQRHPVAESHV